MKTFYILNFKNFNFDLGYRKKFQYSSIILFPEYLSLLKNILWHLLPNLNLAFQALHKLAVIYFYSLIAHHSVPYKTLTNATLDYNLIFK